MKKIKLYFLLVVFSLTAIQAWAYMDVPDNKPLRIYWENTPILNHHIPESTLPQVIKVGFYYTYGYYYKPKGSPYYIYQPYTRPVQTPTGTYYVPTAIMHRY